MPRAMIKAFSDMGVEPRHAWGMTEMSPLGTVCSLQPQFADLPADQKLDILQTQGYPPFMVRDEDHRRRRQDAAVGRQDVRPAQGARARDRRGLFPGRQQEILDEDGYFDTGDVATIDKYGYMRITDRSKDVIKSGGEWISSIDLENLAVGHPKVAEAAVIGVYHPKWDERPLLIVQLKPDQSATREEILQFMDGKIAKWWMPDDVDLHRRRSRTPRPARS